jgi:catechol 2,3-dioxygenase-like lactoylglutathione lyase family enzyme
MNDYVICGIQQIGIGVKDLRESWDWYISRFGMDCPIFEEEAIAKIMLPYTGGEPRSRHAVLVYNLQSGGGFEIWQYKGRTPLEVSGEIEAGNLGIFACKMKIKNVDDTLSSFTKNGTNVIGDPLEDPSGRRTIFIKDPFGNIFQLSEADDWFMNEHKLTGGTCGAIIGVTDIEKARLIYSGILGYDKVVYESTDIFSDLARLPGGKRKLRRILLRRSKPLLGPFSKLMGQSEIELFSSGDKNERKIYEGRFWGDPGFIHLCFDIRGMDSIKEHCVRQGFPFTVDSKASHEGNSFDMGEAAGHFSYIEDPDGTLIEFVETHKIPIMKKLGWYLDLRKRDPYKKLPDWMLKTLRFSRVKS